MNGWELVEELVEEDVDGKMEKDREEKQMGG